MIDNYKIKLQFISVFIVLFTLIYYLSTLNKSYLIKLELEGATNVLETNFDMTTYTNHRDAKSIDLFLKSNTRLFAILSQALDADEQTRDILREELYQLLLPQYTAMKEKGILQFQFIFPNNRSFLRMHKPWKYGDNIANIRYSIKKTNETHIAASGFEEGSTSYAFTNVFPLFDENKRYLGCYEISVPSKSIQDNLTNINQIHSHFIIKKDIFDSKVLEIKDQIYQYIISIEHQHYMLEIIDYIDDECISYVEKHLIAPNKEYIRQRMDRSENFAIYQQVGDKVHLIAFLPIKNFKDKTVAYIVSYTENRHILDILRTYNFVTIIAFIVLLALLYLAYKKRIQNDILKAKSQEQKEFLSLFDHGDITLFKWRNDENWSVEYVSDNVTELTGYTKAEFLNNTIFYNDLMDADDLKNVSQEINNAIAGNKDFFTHKPYKIQTKNLKIKWLYDNTRIIKNNAGELTHFLGYIIDITQMKALEIQLQEFNEHLQEKVEKQMQESLQKDKMLQEQSKLAAMGEMVGSIAHQWRQPLNSLNINIQNLDDDYDDGLIDKEFIDTFINKQTETIQFMSKTIDDFRNFFRVDKITKVFSIKNAIMKTINLQSAQFNSHNISVKVSGDDFYVESIEGEFQQTILNIISNAKDAILENKIPNGLIDIRLDTNKVIISDNAGGIDEKILDRIFEPYFTTKEQGQGTGIGLYMSKMIIEQNLRGTLSASNKGDGAEFVITFKEVL